MALPLSLQDALLGSMLMTRPDVFLGRDDVMQFTFLLNKWNGVIPAPAIMLPRKGSPGMLIRYYVLMSSATAATCSVLLLLIS